MAHWPYPYKRVPVPSRTHGYNNLIMNTLPHQRSFDHILNFAAYLRRLEVHDFPSGTLLWSVDLVEASLQ